MRTVFCQVIAALWLAGTAGGAAAAEEFRYYVWVDEQGIVHAEEKAPKGRDYQVRIIEDINANVIPAKDFRIGDLPAGYGEESNTGSEPGRESPPVEAHTGQAEEPAAPAPSTVDR